MYVYTQTHTHARVHVHQTEGLRDSRDDSVETIGRLDRSATTTSLKSLDSPFFFFHIQRITRGILRPASFGKNYSPMAAAIYTGEDEGKKRVIERRFFFQRAVLNNEPRTKEGP